MTTTKEIDTNGQIGMPAIGEFLHVHSPNQPTSPSNLPHGRGWLAIFTTLAALAVLFIVAMVPRWRANAALEATARDQRPTVSVVTPERPGAGSGLTLPGSTQAIQET